MATKLTARINNQGSDKYNSDNIGNNINYKDEDNNIR